MCRVPPTPTSLSKVARNVVIALSLNGQQYTPEEVKFTYLG